MDLELIWIIMRKTRNKIGFKIWWRCWWIPESSWMIKISSIPVCSQNLKRTVAPFILDTAMLGSGNRFLRKTFDDTSISLYCMSLPQLYRWFSLFSDLYQMDRSEIRWRTQTKPLFSWFIGVLQLNKTIRMLVSFLFNLFIESLWTSCTLITLIFPSVYLCPLPLQPLPSKENKQKSRRGSCSVSWCVTQYILLLSFTC